MANKTNGPRKNRRRSPAKNRRKTTIREKLQGASRVVFPLGVLSGVLLISLIFVSLYVFFSRSDFFRLDTITVEGAGVLTRTEVIKIAGIRPGQNSLAVNLADCRQKLLAADWISACRISRELPGTMKIWIKEYQPLAVVDLGRKYFINKSGRIFKAVGQADPETLPVITGLSYIDLNAQGQPGSKFFKAAIQATDTACQVQHLVPNMTVRQVRVDRDRGISLVALARMGPVQLGFGDYFDKLKQLNRILRNWQNIENGQRLANINFECPGRVVLHPAGKRLRAVHAKRGKSCNNRI